MVGLKHPVGFFGVGNDLVAPFDLQMARCSLAGWRTGESGGVEFCCG